MPVRKLQQAPQTVTYRGVEYRLAVAPPPPPRVVTYAGEQYHLAESLEREPQPTVPPLESSELVEQEDAPKVGLDVEIVSDDDDDEEEYYEPNPPLDRNVYVRLSQDDFHLLSSLPDAEYGMLQDFLSRARNKKMTSGRTEVMASENEVRAAIAALQAFISAGDASPSAITHAQDMASSWGRNYLSPEKPLPKRLPNYNLDTLPRSQNIRTFNYKGARYVLVEGAEEQREKSPAQQFLEMITNEQFSEYFSTIPKAVWHATPLWQARTHIDKMEKGRQAVDSSFMRLNNKEKSLRMAIDAPYQTEQNKENLQRLLTEEGLLEKITKGYVDAVAEYGGALETALMVYKDSINYAIDRGWTSAWAAKTDKAKLKKQILTRLLGITDPKAFVKDYYKIPDGDTRSKKEPQETPTSESPKREESK